MNIRQIIDDTIDREGGYVDHPDDRGGPTKYGITIATLNSWIGYPADKEDVKQLTKDEAREIYEHLYYRKPGIDRLPEVIQPVMFDMCVNIGPSKAIKIMQEVISLMGRSINPDGRVGQDTITSANIACNVYHQEVVRQISLARIQYYKNIVAGRPEQSVFLSGWINRARQFA